MRYEFRQVVEHTQIAPNLLRHWVDVDIIRPVVKAEGPGTRRFFDMRELVLVRVCDWLHRLGLGETEMRTVSRIVDASWSAWGVATLAETGRTLLWIGITPRAALRHDARLATVGESMRSGPLVGLMTPAELCRDVMKGHFGIVVNLADIVADLEQRTGDRLA